MTGPTGASPLDPHDADDADAIAAVTLACPAVVELHEGGTCAIATYLPRRRVVGVRIEDQRVLIGVVLAAGSSVRSLETQVRSAVAPLVGDRRIDLHVADVRPPGQPGEPRGAADAVAQ